MKDLLRVIFVLIISTIIYIVGGSLIFGDLGWLSADFTAKEVALAVISYGVIFILVSVVSARYIIDTAGRNK